jgi:hypothetical protein
VTETAVKANPANPGIAPGNRRSASIVYLIKTFLREISLLKIKATLIKCHGWLFFSAMGGLFFYAARAVPLAQMNDFL